jgi:hypothetical protein
MGFPNPANLFFVEPDMSLNQLSTRFFIEDIGIDLVTDQSAQFSWELTKQTVEDGSKIGDNREKQPVILNMTCELTDDLPDEGDRKWWDKKAELEELADLDQVVTVVTPMDIYEKMIITSMTPSHSPGKATSYPFDIVLEELDTVASNLVSVDPASIPRRVRDKKTRGNANAESDKAGKGDRGNVQPKQSEQSIIDSLLGGLLE